MEAWEKALATHPDQRLVAYILAGMQQGFRVGFSLPNPLVAVKHNIPSAEENPQVVTDRPLLGMRWPTFCGYGAPIRLRSAPKIVCAISDTLDWILHQRGLSSALHYIDYFLTFGKANTHQCQENLGSLTAICEELGVPLQVTKIEGPSTIITFLGIEFNTLAMQMKLPDEKRNRLHTLIRW